MTYTSTVWADERNALGVISCVSASAVNISRAATNGAIPATDAEVIALRVASQDTSGGQSLASVAGGMQRRYGWTGDLASDWATIRSGTASDRWFVVVGHYSALPARFQNSGQGDVFHAVCVGPKGGNLVQFVDALQRGTVESRSMTVQELNNFCATGGFQSLGIAEYSHAPKHWQVSFSSRPFPRFAFWLYTLTLNGWTRQREWGGRWTYRCSAPSSQRVMGKERTMVKVLEGPYANHYLEVGGRIKATEVVG